MALDAQLLDILVCPEDKGPLVYFETDGFLYNPRLKRRYLVKDDIPVMLISEAEAVSDGDAAALDARTSAETLRITGEG